MRYPLVLLVGFELRDLLFERLAPLLGLGGLRDLRLEVGDLLVLRGYVALVLLAVDAGLAVVVLDFALAAALAFGCGLRVALGASLRAIALFGLGLRVGDLRLGLRLILVCHVLLLT